MENRGENKTKDQNILSHFECVGEFHDNFGHPQRTQPYDECFYQDINMIKFRIQLMEEELREFKDGLNNKDPIEMADALCDLSYVVNGAGQCLGLNLDKLARLMSINIDTPEGFVRGSYNDKDMIYTDIFFNKYFGTIETGVNRMDKNLADFCEAVNNKDLNGMGIQLVILLDSIYTLGHALGFDMNAMFREVHRSNMTKLCTNEQDAKESVKRYIEDKTYDDPSYKVKDKYFVVYNKSSGKILKNYKWEEPNLVQFMNYTLEDLHL